MMNVGVPELSIILLFTLLAMGVFLIPWIFYLLTLSKALNRCSPANRSMSPGQVWLLLIPLFNLVWQFIVVSRMASSLRNEFNSRQLPLPEPEPGKGLGIAYCVLMLTVWIPIIGILTAIAGFICWILYWVKIADYSRRLAEGVASTVASA